MIKRRILITGGAGFIGSSVVKLFVRTYPEYHIVNYDDLTYAGNLENLKSVQQDSNYTFVKGNICDSSSVMSVMKEYEIDAVINLAAESHVDRSIREPLNFINTNVIGTVTLLECAREMWRNSLSSKLFYHVSTDEVFGSLGAEGLFSEKTSYDPQSPYAASKAASDHFVRAYGNTFDIPYVVSNCSNNYGPYQFPEKLIPLVINNILNRKELPVYGKGENVRDWLHVKDHARAVDVIFHSGTIRETYNIGGNNEVMNLDLVQMICRLSDLKLNRQAGDSEDLITFVKDRAGHDLRYAIDTTKIMSELGWKPQIDFQAGISETIDWYLKNESWLKNVTSGKYKEYYEEYYQEH